MMKAIKIVKHARSATGQTAELQDIPKPELTDRDDYVLCKVNCVAINPTDWKHIDADGGKPGSTVGSDFCGTIEAIGPRVTKEWNLGDRIATFVHGGNDTHPEDGAFAEYCLAKGDLGMKVPDSITDEQAAGFGIPLITCGQALYQSLGLPLPDTDSYDDWLLVYGGSTGVGILAIQYAVLSGCKVVATASERNWPLLKSLGAIECFDYRDPRCAQDIKHYTNDDLTRALDCISEGDSPVICEQSLSSRGGIITHLLGSAKDIGSRTDIVRKHTSGYTIFGEAFDKLGSHIPARSEDFEHAKMFWALTEDLVRDGRLRPHPIKIGQAGFAGVFDGLEQGRNGKISGAKLVHPIGQSS